MKNFEKYKNAIDAYNAWKDFFEKQDDYCMSCPAKCNTSILCQFTWLYMEAEEEQKLLPCPFCGGEAKLYSSEESWVECTVCHNETEMCACDSGAIEKWNRRKSI